MAILVNNVAFIVASNSSQSFGPFILPNALTTFQVIFRRDSSLTPFSFGEVRELTIDVSLSTDGGLTFNSINNLSMSDGIIDNNEPTGVGFILEIAKSPGRRVITTITSLSAALNLTGSISVI